MALHWKTAEKISKTIDQMVEEWHTTETTKTLVQYLRMTWAEYDAWVQNHRNVPEDWESRDDTWTGE